MKGLWQQTTSAGPPTEEQTMDLAWVQEQASAGPPTEVQEQAPSGPPTEGHWQVLAGLRLRSGLGARLWLRPGLGARLWLRPGLGARLWLELRYGLRPLSLTSGSQDVDGLVTFLVGALCRTGGFPRKETF